MPDELKPMIKIGNVTPPQYLNDAGDWELVKGAGGAYRMQESVEVSGEPFSGSGNLTKEFTEPMSGLVVSNDSVPGASGAADLTFTIDGKTRTVKAGEVYEGRFKPFESVTINSTVPWRAETLQTIGGSTVVVPPADITAPDNVTNLTTSNLTATSLTLTWIASASSDCTGYDVYRGSTLLASVTGTTYNVSGLTQATQYTFTVKAKDAANNIASGTSTTVTTSSSADTTAPTNVTNLTTANITQTGLTLNWTASASSDVASYDIYNGTTFLANVTSITYNVNGLAASTAYTFWVKAKDASGNAASGTSVDATTIAPAADTTAPSNVTNLTTSGLTQNGVTLNWTAATDNVAVTGYEIYNGASLVTTVTGTTYNVTGLTASTQYTFTVKAKDAAGNVASGTSTTFTTSAAADTTPPNPITGLTAGTVTSSSVPLTWTISSSGDVANQEVAYSSNGGTSYTVASGVINPSSNSYTVTGLAANQAYTFRVVAIDGAGNRSTAVTTTATTAAAGLTTYVSASFDGSDSTTSLPVAETGQSWTAITGTWGVSSNQAYPATSVADSVAVIDSTKSDGEVQVTFAQNPYAATNVRLYFRVVDANNLVMVQSGTGGVYQLFKRVAGTYTQLGSNTTGFTPANGDVVKVVLSGSSIAVYINGTQRLTATDAFNSTATKHGIGTNSSTAPRFNDFTVKA
ncbi:fibronectin type III domain-containing protein [Paenibacillus frigoriresistens]|uniref:fibronectin type III domain-containing protein n=1 Tax=Paenibacillus alginolyticus TaxID=59839 RepID=UPI001563E243|nr:fibronectin type III domain-containing protein [Paenibacillus frigoriresistens]NRF91517.1 fibronectin type III domain-containing protein [Paenibacillus frigoriresistens]